MARVKTIQTNFTGGEFSPRLEGRVDFDKYFNSCKTLENMQCFAHGGARRRPGTAFVAEVKTSSKAVRLIPFEFSTTQAYIIEFGDQYIRFYKDNGQITSGGSAYEVATPWLEAELFDLQFAQSADVMWVVHPNHQPRKITRTGHTSWTVATYAPTGNAFSSSDNYPSCVTFWQERLWFANTNTDPQTIWATKSGDFENMDLGSAAAGDGIKLTIASGKVNVIRYLAPSRVLLVGTTGGEFALRGATTDEGVTPSNVNVRSESTYGTKNVMPLRSEAAVLFIQRAGRKLRELRYKYDSDSYSADDLTILAEHVTEGGVTQLEYVQQPDPIIWAVRADGTLLGLTYETAHKVLAWHRHTTDGSFESVAVIPNPAGTADELWCVVNRTVDGATKRYVEYFTDTYFTDSTLAYDGSSTASLSGLSHLEGKSVAIRGIAATSNQTDYAVYPSQTVDSAAVAVSPNVTKAQIGLGFTSTLKTQRPEINTGQGTSQGTKRRYSEIFVRLYESLGVEINGDQLPFRSSADEMDSPPALFTGDKRVSNLGWDREGRIEVKQTQPLPLQVSAIFGTFETHD
ncbi:hypothetical protein [uncultured Mediterranean phage uvDeep-CGR2-AD3-C191]|nr:hypothetical protein [uncultured Mediterranean phage uvDeep-CGR2-AD3-C191]